MGKPEHERKDEENKRLWARRSEVARRQQADRRRESKDPGSDAWKRDRRW